MSRAKVRGFTKQPVERVLLVVEHTERRVQQNPVTGDIEVVHIVTPARYRQGKAAGPTTTHAQRNKTDIKVSKKKEK